MTNLIKPNEAMSHGNIVDKQAKERERQEIARQVEEFLKNGGKVVKL